MMRWAVLGVRRRWRAATAALVCWAAGCAAPAGADSLLVASYDTGNLLRYNAETFELRTVFAAGGAGGLVNPGELAIGPDGNVYVASYTSNSVFRFNGVTGAALGAFAGPASGLLGPRGMAFGPDGKLYVASSGNNQVLRYDPASGNALGGFTSGAALDAPIGLTFGADDHLYVGTALPSVLKFDGASGQYLGLFANQGLTVPQALKFGPDGNLYVGNEFSRSIARFNGATGALIDQFVPSDSGGLRNPQGFDFGNGKLFVSNLVTTGENDGVLSYSVADGSFLGAAVAGGGQSGSTLSQPSGLMFLEPAWHNASHPEDVDAGGFVAPLDVLIVINELNANGVHLTPLTHGPAGAKLPYYDVTGDELITPQDALVLINLLNNAPPGAAFVPEPTTGALVLAALGAIAFWARRRRPR